MNILALPARPGKNRHAVSPNNCENRGHTPIALGPVGCLLEHPAWRLPPDVVLRKGESDQPDLRRLRRL